MQNRPVDLVAVTAIAIVCCFLEPIVHEGLGHGLTALALGAHVQHVSSVDLAYDQSSVAEPANRAIASAGILANLVFGIIALALLARLGTARTNTRYFLWLFGHSNLFVGSGYMLALSFAGFGDIQALVEGLTWRPILQVALTLIGVAIALATYVHAARTLDEFLGRENRKQRAFALTVVPYFVIGVVNTVAGTLNPESPTLVLLSAAAASFGGNMPMAWLPFATRRICATTPEKPLTPVRDGFWVASAAVSALLLFVVWRLGSHAKAPACIMLRPSQKVCLPFSRCES